MKNTQFTLKPFLAESAQSEVCRHIPRSRIAEEPLAVQLQLDKWLLSTHNLKGGDTKMAESESKGDKPDYKGGLDIVAWLNTDKFGKKYIALQIGNRVNLFRNDKKLDEQFD